MESVTVNYARAVAPGELIVLGQRLRWLTLGHAHLLAARENSFSVASTSEPGFCDVVEAVFIIAHEKFTEAHAALDSPLFVPKVKLWGWLCRKHDWARVVADFQAWYQKQIAPPVLLTSGQDRFRYPGTPILTVLTQHMAWKRGLGFSEALNFPFGIALWDYCTSRELDGSLELATDEDLELVAARRRAQEPELAQN